MSRAALDSAGFADFDPTDFDSVSAFDQAFRGTPSSMVDSLGGDLPMAVAHWAADPDAADRAFFVTPCTGPTLDVGCGPGRLVGALVDRGIPSLGIDVSAEAVRQTRERGAVALRRDVFSNLPGEGRWQFALLADGNVGIGGDPVSLLGRLRELMTPDGRVIAEVAGPGVGIVRDSRRLRVGDRLSEPFAWAVVGLDAMSDLAAEVGLVVETVQSLAGRHAVTLAAPSPGGRS
ncbi:methyltransferase domain protein [Aeromicrobium marinum DSM 15272]|uniref:Methyltransferase domain protein n=1 Tax=Aeromicrobium marinum DSM 15272 TaxID=585531 RepID=E2SF56_9ACTN|nr:class I SAM-dependent methyltransferase [Aeromicrobium marinum]EFQ82141.1 methyltransferase domain protein [Aeromicrobium marinum DSM 15272]